MSEQENKNGAVAHSADAARYAVASTGRQMGKMKAMMDDVEKFELLKREMEKMKAEKEFVQMAKMPINKYPAEIGPQDSRGFRSTPIIQDYSELGDLSRGLKDKIESDMRTLQKIEALQAEVDKMTFKIGDAAFMKEQGNVIIKGISVDPENLDVAYVVVGRRGEFRTKELLPINETTSILYGQK